MIPSCLDGTIFCLATSDEARWYHLLPRSTRKDGIIFHDYTNKEGMVTMEEILEGNYGYKVEFKIIAAKDYEKNGGFRELFLRLVLINSG